MRWSDISDVRCSIARTLSVIGDRWTLLIIRETFLGTRRFDDFCERTGAARHLVAERLNTLIEHEVLEKRRYSTKPERFEYRLTAKGRDLYPIVVSLMAWGDRWAADKHGPPLELTHEPCGHAVTPALACPACREFIDPHHMRAVENTVGRHSTGADDFLATLPGSGAELDPREVVKIIREGRARH